MNTIIQFDELEYSDDKLYYQLYCYKGAPFSGVAQGRDEDGSFEYSYANGLPDGTCRKWYPNGVLKEYAEYKRGALNGEFSSFFPDGRLRERGKFEFGFKIEFVERLDDGREKSHYKMADGDSKWIIIEHLRATRG